MPLIVQSTKQSSTSFNLTTIKNQMQIATNSKATLEDTQVAIGNMYQNGTSQKLSPQAQKAVQALARYIHANKAGQTFAFVLGKDHQDHHLLLLTIANHPAQPKANATLQRAIPQAPSSTLKQDDLFLVKQLSWVTKALHKVEFGILFWIYQNQLSGQVALASTALVPTPIEVVNFQRVKTPQEQLQDKAWVKIIQVIHSLTPSQLKISVDAQQLPSQTKLAAKDIVLAIQKIIFDDDEISTTAKKLIKEDNIKVQPVDKTGAIIITITNYGHDKTIAISRFKATGTPLAVTQAQIDAAQDKANAPTRLNQVFHGQMPAASDVSAPAKDGVTFKFQAATTINDQGESTFTYEVDADPQVQGTITKIVTFVVSGFETKAQKDQKDAQAKIDVAKNGVHAPTRLNQVFQGRMPIASDVNAPIKGGVTFKFQAATTINDQGESTLTYEVDADPPVEGTMTKEITFVVSGFETKGQKDVREVIKKRLDTIMQNIRDGVLVIPNGITSSQFDEYVQAMGNAFNAKGEVVTNKFAEKYQAHITSLTIPRSFTTIGNWFRHFDKITSLTLNDNLQSIGRNAFLEAKLVSLIIPNAVTTIGDQAFFSAKLKSLTIPNAVTTIGSKAFTNSLLTSLILGDHLQTIGDQAFRHANLKTLTIPNAVTTIGVATFLSSPLTSLILGNQLQTIGKQAFRHANLKTLTIPNAVTAIGNSAFLFSPLTSLILGDQLQTIDGYAFWRAKLKSLTIPNAVTTIGGWAFNFSPLASLILGEKLQTIGSSAFRRAQLKSLTIPNTVITIGKWAFEYSPLTSLKLGDQLKTIGPATFKAAKLKSLIIPNAVTTIGGYAFFSSSSLTSLILGNQLQTIGICAFRHVKLISLTIPNTVTTIGDNAFTDSPLTSLQLGDQLKTIGYQAFFSAKLKSLTIPNAVTAIGSKAFAYSPLTTLSLGNQLKTIGEETFWSAELTSLIIPDAVTFIGKRAFIRSFQKVTKKFNLFKDVRLGPNAFRDSVIIKRISRPTKSPG